MHAQIRVLFIFTHFARIPYSITEFLPRLMRNMIYTLRVPVTVTKTRQGVEMRCLCPWHHGVRKGVMRRKGDWIFPGRWYHFTLKWLQKSRECLVWNFASWDTPLYSWEGELNSPLRDSCVISSHKETRHHSSSSSLNRYISHFSKHNKLLWIEKYYIFIQGYFIIIFLLRNIWIVLSSIRCWQRFSLHNK